MTLAHAYIGLMSGTSLDGVDGVLVTLSPSGHPRLIARATAPIEPALRAELLALNHPTDNELDRAARASLALVEIYAELVHELLRLSGLAVHEVRAIGAHGQTIRHQPHAGYTLQLNAPARLAELTGIGVVADFRSRDIAAGGHGAPLVPAFHHAVFGADRPRVIVNLGGMANVTLLMPDRPVLGFDTGPANVLMDAWCHRHTGAAYDREGQWGAQGQVVPALLNHLIRSEPWFAEVPPKSTGREQFNLAWLDARLEGYEALAAHDVQTTLQALTALTVTGALHAQGLKDEPLFVCGGGAFNTALREQFSRHWPGSVACTQDLGIPPQDVEAMAFAWLAWAHMEKIAGNLPEVTGSKGTRLLGAYWPA